MGSNAFQFAGASVIGTSHEVAKKNNQDAFRIADIGHATVAVVCDGCGSVAFSEVGAQISAALFVQAMRAAVAEDGSLDRMAFLTNWYNGFIAVARAVGADGIQQMLVSTVVGAVVTRTHATFIVAGDGVVIVNGDRKRDGQSPGNNPEYPLLAMLESEENRLLELDRLFPVVAVRAVDELQSFVIATDGAAAIDTLYGPDKDPWNEILQDRFFENSEDAFQHHLAYASSDDATLVICRRAKEA